MKNFIWLVIFITLLTVAKFMIPWGSFVADNPKPEVKKETSDCLRTRLKEESTKPMIKVKVEEEKDIETDLKIGVMYYHESKATTKPSSDPFKKVEKIKWQDIAVIRDIKDGYVQFDCITGRSTEWRRSDFSIDNPKEGAIYTGYDWHDDGKLFMTRVTKVTDESVSFQLGCTPPDYMSMKIDDFKKLFLNKKGD